MPSLGVERYFAYILVMPCKSVSYAVCSMPFFVSSSKFSAHPPLGFDNYCHSICAVIVMGCASQKDWEAETAVCLLASGHALLNLSTLAVSWLRMAMGMGRIR
jgi:hypothetical protein